MPWLISSAADDPGYFLNYRDESAQDKTESVRGRSREGNHLSRRGGDILRKWERKRKV